MGDIKTAKQMMVTRNDDFCPATTIATAG